jgi:hypothetical protein
MIVKSLPVWSLLRNLKWLNLRSMRVRFSLVLISVLLSSVIFSQSCIVYKKEKDGIYIGADTRMVSYVTNESNRRIEPTYLSICKIDQVDSIHFAVTGYSANIALDEARKILQNTKPFSDAVALYATSFGQKLADMLETTRHEKPDFYKKNFPAGLVLGGSIFFYYEKGILNGRVVRITLITQPSEKATVATKNDNLDSIGVAGNNIGTRNILYNSDVWKKGAVTGIKNLIGIEKMASPSQVEGVADILFVSSKNEVEWVQRKRCL